MSVQPTTIRLSKDLKAWLKKLAKREGRTFSAQLIYILRVVKGEK